jgi:hypothetical protein
MSFYVRKSIKAGAFRFNLSKSGVGISTGVPGFRIGTGPRGNYVRVGGNGVSYQSTRHPGHAPDAAWTPPPPAPIADVLLEDVTGASAAELAPSGSGEIVQQLNEAASRWRLFPWAIGLLVIVLLAQPVLGAILLILGSPGLIWLWFNDRSRRTVVAFYDVNDEAARWFQGLVDAFENLTQNDCLWRVNSSGHVQTSYQYKVNAGATTIVSRSSVKASLQSPTMLATNIAVPSITSGKAALFFLPDRLVVRDAKRFSDVAYATLETRFAPLRFTESGRVPRDSQQVDTTWQYVNVRGGPDRRFKDNRQYPVMLYGELILQSSTGLHWELQCSQPRSAELLDGSVGSAPAELLAQTPG